jgi:1-acyl-sn-glycerol-3-phosphate acyltransferase
MRLKLRLAAMGTGLLVCLPLHYLWKLAGFHSPWPRRFLGWIGYAAGMRVEVEGTPLRANALLVSNHVSWLDIMVIAGVTGAAFVSKDDVARWPVFGWLSRLNNTVFVARGERGAVRGQADSLRAALATGQPVALFPEGTTGNGRDLLPFRASLLAALFPPPPDIRVQPVAVDYGAAAGDIAWLGEEAAGANAKRVLSRAGTTWVVIRFLEPVDPAAAGDRKALAALTRSRIAAALGASAAPTDPV